MKHHAVNHGPQMNRFELPDILGTSLGMSSIFIKLYTGIGFSAILPSNLLTWIFDKSFSELTMSVILVAISGLLVAGFNALFMGALGYLGGKIMGKAWEALEKRVGKKPKKRSTKGPTSPRTEA